VRLHVLVLGCLWILTALPAAAQAPAAPSAPATFAPKAAERNGIFIVGALHRLHEQVPGFDYAALRRTIEAIDPQVMLLETRPDELSGRTDTPGRPEYPRVVWPLLAEHTGIVPLPLEPGGKLFETWVAEASADFAALEKDNPQGASAWESYQRSLTSLLKLHWRTPVQAHDAVTADMARSWYLVQYGVTNKQIEAGQERWDGFMIERAHEAVRSHPDKRILILASYRNRHLFDAALRKNHAPRIVDMEKWLAANAAK